MLNETGSVSESLKLCWYEQDCSKLFLELTVLIIWGLRDLVCQ